MTVRFLKHKMAEFESLEREIEQLRREVNTPGAPDSPSETASPIPSPWQGEGRMPAKLNDPDE